MNNKLHSLALPILALTGLLAMPKAAQTGSTVDSAITIHAGKVMNKITPWITGSCIEDVNHEIYGGLYAQMIFGESFEEPPTTTPIIGWKVYGGQWSAQNGVVKVEANDGAKLVQDAPLFRDGAAECDVMFRDDKGDNAGLIIRVQDPRVGPDAWIGYEVSISAKNQSILLGRHNNDWHLLKSVPAGIQVGKWHHLKVEMAGATFRLFLDGSRTPSLEFTDPQPLPAGKVGLRTWVSNAAFRRLSIAAGTSSITDSLNRSAGKEGLNQISGMWDPIRTGTTDARFGWDADNPYNSGHSQKLEIKSGKGTVGVANRGLNRWGLSVVKDSTYQGRIYLRQRGYSGKVTVALQSADGSRTYAIHLLDAGSKNWQRREFTLRSTGTDANARFAVWIDRPGAVWVDQAVLTGTGSALYKGLPIRADIANGLVKQGVTFLRYAGLMVNAPEYRWKKMIGDPDKRPQYKGWWYPQTTNGFGIEEFLRFCEAAKIEPAFAINIEESPLDARDLVEYLNGPATSPWGKKRAANGHPKPYGVKYIEIGNEETTNAHYIERFQLLYEAMRPKDPTLQFVIAAWWEPDNPVTKRIVQELNGMASLWDVHVDADGLHDGVNVDNLFTRMERLVNEWVPGSQLKACIFEENGGRHDIQRALGHARILNATARHGDFVLIDCPANCLQAWLQNDNGWDQGQLFYTNRQVWGMPPYYAQQMAAANYAPNRVDSSVKDSNNTLDVTATKSEDGRTLILRVVNVSSKPHHASVRVDGLTGINKAANVWTLGGALTDRNLPTQPEKVRSMKSQFLGAGNEFEYEFAPYSYTILRLRR
jgi:alpha-L-arabinofuranosidase